MLTIPIYFRLTGRHSKVYAYVMRNTYALIDFYEALGAWRKHEQQYLASLEAARQPRPPQDVLENYMRIWVEGYLESRANYAEANKSEG